MNIDTLSSQFKAFSEPVRLRLLYLLLERDEVCVCDLVESLNLKQSVVSRHLAYLKNNNLIEARREGTWVHYRIKREQVNVITQLFKYFQEFGHTSAELQHDLTQMGCSMGECK